MRKFLVNFTLLSKVVSAAASSFDLDCLIIFIKSRSVADLSTDVGGGPLFSSADESAGGGVPVSATGCAPPAVGIGVWAVGISVSANF